MLHGAFDSDSRHSSVTVTGAGNVTGVVDEIGVNTDVDGAAPVTAPSQPSASANANATSNSSREHLRLFMACTADFSAAASGIFMILME